MHFSRYLVVNAGLLAFKFGSLEMRASRYSWQIYPSHACCLVDFRLSVAFAFDSFVLRSIGLPISSLAILDRMDD